MSNRQALLPSNATALENALSEALDRTPELSPGIVALRGFKFDPNDSVVPYLIIEYGLEEIEEFFPVRREVIAEGVAWRRLVGTPAAVYMALRWIGYQASIEEEWVGRRKWNTFQLRFPTLPASDHPDLERIEKIAEISTPLRSRFRRGVHLYDAGALIGDFTRLDDSMLERESGIAITPAGTLWSFGRANEYGHFVSEAEGLELDNWIDPAFGVSLRWADMTYPWSAAAFPWSSHPAAQRRALLASWFVGKPVYACFRDKSGSVIGYRLCRAVRQVRQKTGGPYVFAANSYEPHATGTAVYVEALTDFEDADDIECGSVSLVIGSERIETVKPGKLWLSDGDLVGGVEFASKPLAVRLRKTVRERVSFLLEWENPEAKALAAIGDELNAFALDFTDGSFATRLTTQSELSLNGTNGFAMDFRDNSYAVRD